MRCLGLLLWEQGQIQVVVVCWKAIFALELKAKQQENLITRQSFKWLCQYYSKLTFVP